jgi:cobalt-zinc-cadmium efflux system outer membrane protein
VFTQRLLAACVTAWLPWAAAHPHPGIDELPEPPYLAPELNRAFEAAWKLSPESVHAEGLLLRAEAEKDVAVGMLAGAPAIELDHREARGSSSSTARESEAGVLLPLWMPGQRAARGAAASAEAALAEASLRAARLRVAGEVREAAWLLLGAENELAAVRLRIASLRELGSDVDRRVKAGDLPRADEMAATAETLAASSALGEVETRLAAARSRWQMLTGQVVLAAADEPDTAAGDISQHPALAHARALTLRAQRQLDYVKASRRDAPELAIRLRRETSDANLPAQNGIGIGVRIPLGTDARNAPRDAEAVAALDNARAEERRTLARIESELRSARAAVEIARQRLVNDESRLSLLRERAALIDRSFRAGESPLADLLRANDAAAQAQAAVARQRADAGLARARLLQATGVLP